MKLMALAPRTSLATATGFMLAVSYLTCFILLVLLLHCCCCPRLSAPISGQASADV
jgi:hypothetical protein